MPDADVEALRVAGNVQQLEIERLQQVSGHLVQVNSTLRKDHVCLNVRHHSLTDCLDQTGLLSRPHAPLQPYTNRYVSSLCSLMFEMEDWPRRLVSFAGMAASGHLSATSRSCMESLAAPLVEAAAASGARGLSPLPVHGGAGRRSAVPSLEGVLEHCRALQAAESASSTRSSGRSVASCARGGSQQGADDTGLSTASSGLPIEDGRLGSSSSSLDAGSEDLWLNSALAEQAAEPGGNAAPAPAEPLPAPAPEQAGSGAAQVAPLWARALAWEVEAADSEVAISPLAPAQAAVSAVADDGAAVVVAAVEEQRPSPQVDTAAVAVGARAHGIAEADAGVGVAAAEEAPGPAPTPADGVANVAAQPPELGVVEATPPLAPPADDVCTPQEAKQQPKAKSPATPPSKDGGRPGATWEVVGGLEKGGIVVRVGKDLSSPQIGSFEFGPRRLKPGARVMQMNLQDGRLKYQLVTGDGPGSGWVSTHVAGKPLLIRLDVSKRDPLLDMFATKADVAADVADGKADAPLPSHSPEDMTVSTVDVTVATDDCVMASGVPLSTFVPVSAVPSWVMEGNPSREARGPGSPVTTQEATPEGAGQEASTEEAAAEVGAEAAEASAAAAERQEPSEAAICEAEVAPSDTQAAAPAVVFEGPQLPDTPHVFWTYWDQGAEAMPAFNKLCVETWRKTHPDWRIRVLDKDTVLKWVEEEDLPPTFSRMKMRQHRADCVKTAVMVRHGGIYMDSSIMLWQDITEVTGWAEIEAGHYDYAGYYFHEKEFVENYFLAARRGAPLVQAWHQMHLDFWETRTSAGALDKDSFFRGVRISRIDPSERNYLSQHACWMKLHDCNIDGFREKSKRAKLIDTAGPRGALWVFNKLSRMATLHAQKSFHRPPPPMKRKGFLPFGGLGNPLSTGLGRGVGGRGLGRGGLWGGLTPTPQPQPRGKSWHQALGEMLLWKDEGDFKSFMDELDRNQVPLAKFTGHASFLGDSTRKDLLQWKNLIRSLLLRGLGQSAALPTPTNWSPFSL